MSRIILLNIARGYAMGAADLVPGVSGGTIALIVGIYERLVASVRSGSSALGHLLRGDLSGARDWIREIEWSLILPLLVGILAAVATLAHLLERLLHDQPVVMAAMFAGLVIGSIVVAWQMLSDRSMMNIGVMLGVAIVLFLALGLRSGTTEETVAQASEPTLIVFYIAGAIAICAMILPGISGSFLLVMLGMYGPVLSAVTDRDFATLAVFLVGAVTGLALFSQLLHHLLKTHHDTVLAALIGLMIGSMRVLWPWPFGVDSTALHLPDGYVIPSIIAAAVAAVAVIVIARFAQGLEEAPALGLSESA